MNKLQAVQCLEFEGLDRTTQMDLLQKQGTYIGKMKQGQTSCLLYQYQSIYIEVSYISHRSIVQSVTCYADTAILDRYFSANDESQAGS